MRPSQRPGGPGLERTHVRYEDKWYIVSTIERRCSSPLAQGTIYAETIVFDALDGRMEAIVYQDSGAAGSLRVHDEIVNKIRSGGIAALDKEAEDD